MKKYSVRKIQRSKAEQNMSDTPMGIVISSGKSTAPTPLFSAYIWCSYPEMEQSGVTRAA